MSSVVAAVPDPGTRNRRLASRCAVIVAAGGLAACNTQSDLSGSLGPAVAPTVAISVADLPGKWGLASYRTEADKVRTETEAKGACGNPYVVTQGSNGGVLMHLADQAQPSEVYLKVARDGRTFIGPRGAAGVAQDRLVVSYENGVLITEWLDPGVRERYGTMVLVRCAAA